MEYYRVKEYAELIQKSDKTVYKLIKEGLVPAKKTDSGYHVAVDTNLLNIYQETSKTARKLLKKLKTLEERVEAIESRLG